MLEADSLWELVEKRAQLTPDLVMLIGEDGRRLTFSELRDEAEEVAAGLARLGVSERSTVSWQLPNWVESVVLVIALARLGAVQNPIAPMFRQREVSFITQQLGSDFLVVPSQWKEFDYEQMAKDVAQTTPGLEVIVLGDELPRGPVGELGPPLPAESQPPVRWVLYTSGTTADPKGARHTDRTFQVTATNIAATMHMDEADRAAVVFPLAHIGGIIFVFANLMSGSASLIVERFGRDSVRTMTEAGVTIAGSGVPFYREYLQVQRASDTPVLSDVRVFVGGGSTRPPSIHQELKDVFGPGLVSGYGLTEVGSFTGTTIDDPDWARAVTEGRPYPGTEIRIVDPDGVVLGPDEEGEVRGRGPQVMVGYVDADLDAMAFDEDGFFRTGDLGYLDKDGFLRITGRIKDVIIRKGENISASEIENLLISHEAIDEVAVIGLPDDTTGERACAVIVLVDPSRSVDLSDLAAHLLSSGMPIQKVPEQVEFVAELPKSVAGKVVKPTLKKIIEDRSLARSGQPS